MMRKGWKRAYFQNAEVAERFWLATAGLNYRLDVTELFTGGWVVEWQPL